MKELRKIILINSIRAYAEIELDEATHFYGKNGRGKTDYLQLISSFYTGRLKSPYAAEKGSSYYLPHSNSWIIFEVVGAKGLFSLAFHREEAIPQAYFLNGDYEKENFFKKGKALSWKEVKANHKKQKLHQAGPFDLEESNWQILNGSYAGKDKSDLRRYAISTSSHADFLPRLYRDFWLKGKIRFDLLKEVLCSFEGLQDAKVELAEIVKASKSLRKDLRSLRSWRSAEGDIQEVLNQDKSLRQLQERDEKLKHELPLSLKLHQDKKKSLKSDFERAKKAWEELQRESDSTRADRLEVLKELYLEKGALTYKLSLAKEKNAHYEQAKIQEKIQQFFELSLRKQKSELLRELAQDSKKEIEKTQAWWEARLKKEKAWSELAEKALKEKEALLDQWAAVKEELEAEKESLNSLEEAVENLRKEQRAIEAEKLQVSGEGHEVSVGKYVRQIQRAREESIELKLQIRLSEEQTNGLQRRKEKEFEALEKERKESEEKSLNLLKEKREAYNLLESQIANSGRAFMGWLEKNYPDWQQTVGKLLKDEVLLSPFLSPGIERINELFYGIHLELSELPESSLSLEQLQKDKEELEKEIGKREKGLAELQQKHAKQIDTREKYYRQKSRELKRQLQKNSYELQQLELGIKKNEAELDKGSLRRDQRKEAALIKLSYREADLEKAMQEAGKTHRLAVEKWEEQKSQLEKEEQQGLKKWESKLKKEKEEILAKWEAFQQTKPEDSADTIGLGPDIFLWEKLQKEIQQYESDKSQYINQMNGWEQALERLDMKIANRESLEHLSEAERNRKLEQLKDEFGSAEQTWNRWQELEKEANSWMKNLSVTSIEAASEDPDGLENLLPQLEEIEDEKNLQLFGMRSKLRQALSYFSPENIFGLSLFDPENPDQDEEQVAQLRKLKEEGKFEELLEGIHQRQSELLATVNELFSNLQPDLRKLETRLSKLSEELQEHFKEHLTETSQFAIRYSEKGIFKSLRNLRSFYLENRDQLGGSSLFNQGDKVDLNRQAFKLLEELDKHLQALPNMELLPFHMLELEWKMGEEKFLTDFGQLSPKTHRAIQTYLVSTLLEELLSKEKDLSLHLCLDDVLDFEPDFLDQIQEKLKESGIKLCSTASHSSKLILTKKQVELILPAQT